jgi:hypothetical protein
MGQGGARLLMLQLWVVFAKNVWMVFLGGGLETNIFFPCFCAREYQRYGGFWSDCLLPMVSASRRFMAQLLGVGLGVR